MIAVLRPAHVADGDASMRWGLGHIFDSMRMIIEHTEPAITDDII